METLSSNPEDHPLNLNSPKFDSEAYVNNLIQKKGLDELVAVEEDMVQNVRRLDSEMQQLVYENYNKFLTATNTVRNMQAAFTAMDNEVQSLSNRMKTISNLSESLSEMFDKNRDTVRQLTEKSRSIERLQYFVKLPEILQNLVDEKNFKRAIEIYMSVKPKLERYKDVKSMNGIYTDCKALMERLETQFREALTKKIFLSDKVLEAAQSLILFGVPEIELRTDLLNHWRKQLGEEMNCLKSQLNIEPSTSTKTIFADILEFVDGGCCTFLTNLSLYILLFVQLFKNQSENVELMETIENFMSQLETVLIERFQLEKNSCDCALFVKALDRISSKISVFSRILPGLDFNKMNSSIVVIATKHEIKICRENIKKNIEISLKNTFLSIETENFNNSKFDETFNKHIFAMVSKLEQSFLVLLKTCLANLLLFNASDMNLNTIDPEYFGYGGNFSVTIYENIVVGAIADLGGLVLKSKEIFSELLETKSQNTASNFFLVLSNFLHSFRTKQVEYLVDLSQEQFKLIEFKGKHLKNRKLILTSLEELKTLLKSYTEITIRHYIEIEFSVFDQLIENLIESFDWLQCAELPRSVRELTKQVFCLIQNEYEKVQSVTGESNNFKKNQNFSSTLKRAPSNLSNNISTYEMISIGSSSIDASGIIEKLWSDDLDDANVISIFDKNGSPTVPETKTLINGFALEFRVDSIVTAIIHLTLRKIVETIILKEKKFSEFGLQQLQVDCAYLKHHLWKFTFDEHILNILIDDCITAAVLRCSSPKLLEPTIVCKICEES